MKFLFDNNLPPALAEALGTLTAAHWQGVHSVVHLRDRFDKSVSDTFYIEKLGSEGDWSIVTHDASRKVWSAKRWLAQILWCSCWTKAGLSTLSGINRPISVVGGR